VDKGISFDKLGQLHLSYLKGLGGPYCIVKMNSDKYIPKHFKGEPISDEEYASLIEKRFRKCGGKFNSKCGCPEFQSD